MKRTSYYIITFCIALTALVSCSGSESQKQSITVDQDDSHQSLNTKFDGKIFSIPSPILTMLLVKKVSPTFYNEYLSPIQKVDYYQSEFKRSLMAGVYGADLGYASIYREKKNIMDYLITLEKTTNSLGLEGSFDKSFIERYQNNLDNSDSMMHIVSDAFKNADLFLKSGDRKAVSALMLAGGWTQSMYIASALAIKHNNIELNERIGDQTQTLETMISLLEVNNKDSQNDQLIQLYKDLYKLFDAIEVTYEYNEPETNEKTKTTTLNHNITFSITEQTMKNVHEKITAIRRYIIE